MPRVETFETPWKEEAEAEREMQPQREAYVSGSELNALLGRGSQFEGKLAFEGKVRIDGNFRNRLQEGWKSTSMHVRYRASRYSRPATRGKKCSSW